MTAGAPVLTAGFWRTRRSAAIAGIVFAVLLLAAMTTARIALAESSFQTLQADAQRRALIRLGIGLVPFAGIAFLWFIGVVREQLGEVGDRLFSTVFMGGGLLFLAMLFGATVTSVSLQYSPDREPMPMSSHTAATSARDTCPYTPCGWRRCSRSR
jgi:hypothetical protein